jgi:acyl dehydratase
MPDAAQAPAMHVVSVDELPSLVGRTLGPSSWLVVDQARIEKFAEATGDYQWIHVDVERAAREMPGGKTIAHGYLTLSLVPVMMRELIRIECRNALNYGSNRVRYTGTVPAGARIRLQQKIAAAEPIGEEGVRLTSNCTVLVEGQEKPALVAEVMAIFYR